MEIPLPQVRRLTPAELTARRAAVAAWRARLKQQPQPAAQVQQSTNIATSCFPAPVWWVSLHTCMPLHTVACACCFRCLLVTRLVLHMQQKQPAGVQLAAKAAVAVAAGSSSDEESDDETFLLRHQPLEMEERQRFLSYSIGARRLYSVGTIATAPSAATATAMRRVSPIQSNTAPAK